MPTKKKKRKIQSGSGWLSNQFDKGLYLQFYKDRGMGLETIIKDGIRPHNEIHSYKDLIKFLKSIKMSPAATHQIIDRFLFKDKNQRMNFLKHYVAQDIRLNRIELDRLLAAIKKYNVTTVFKNQDPDQELLAFERNTLYKRPKVEKTFKKDLTILREAIGKKRSRDGSYTKKQLEIYKKRALKKLLSK